MTSQIGDVVQITESDELLQEVLENLNITDMTPLVTFTSKIDNVTSESECEDLKWLSPMPNTKNKFSKETSTCELQSTP